VARYPSLIAGLILAVSLHADWHLARPSHQHRLLNPSFNWQYHWVATAAVFMVVGWIIARFWPQRRWAVGIIALAIAVVVAQLIVPLGQAAVFQHRFGYASEPGQWRAFWQGLAAAVPAYVLALWLGRKQTTEFDVANETL
jgi:hypothetical protein